MICLDYMSNEHAHEVFGHYFQFEGSRAKTVSILRILCSKLKKTFFLALEYKFLRFRQNKKKSSTNLQNFGHFYFLFFYLMTFFTLCFFAPFKRSVFWLQNPHSIMLPRIFLCRARSVKYLKWRTLSCHCLWRPELESGF